MPTPTFHAAMLPWFAVGHLTPYLHLSNKLAERGHTITFFLPKKAIPLLQPINTHPHLITFHPLSIPHVDGLPPGAETASDISMSSVSFLAAAMDLTRGQVEAALAALKPDFVFYDTAHWIPEIGRRFGIKSVCYNVVSAAAITIALVPARKMRKDEPFTEDELVEPPPGYVYRFNESFRTNHGFQFFELFHRYPSKTVVFRRQEAKSLMFISMPFGNGITFYDRTTTAMKESDAIAMRTCKEMEDSLCDYLSSQFNKPVFLTGPALPEPSTAAKLDTQWTEWLDQFEPKSVVFCAFGTQWVLEKDQFQELLLGFELTNLPFLVALKLPSGYSTLEEALPSGFEERTKGRGMIYQDWLQQTLILDHKSVGCFVTHGGHGSMWESLMCESQLVMVPHLGDQILNTRLLVEELQVGVEVEREDNGWFSKESLCKAIKSVMDKDSELGDILRKNHAQWKEKLNPNFINGYIDNFVHNLEELRST